jgi:hypothetical protein
MPEDENYIEKAIRETEELICDAERELERLRRQLSWLVQQRTDNQQLSLEGLGSRLATLAQPFGGLDLKITRDKTRPPTPGRMG